MKRLAPPVVSKLPTGSLVSVNLESKKTRGSNVEAAPAIAVERITGTSAAMRTSGEYIKTPATVASRSSVSGSPSGSSGRSKGSSHQGRKTGCGAACDEGTAPSDGTPGGAACAGASAGHGA